MNAVLPGTVLPGDAGAEMTTQALLDARDESLAPNPPNAAKRLALSRARLRAAMQPPVRESIDREPGRSTPPWVARIQSRFQRLPGVALVADALASWWARHPLRPATVAGGEVSRAVVEPLARKHPLALVASAAAAGAAIAATRPWRWLLKRALFAGLVPHLASRIISKLPLDSWLTMLNAVVSSPTPRSPAEPPNMPARRH